MLTDSLAQVLRDRLRRIEVRIADEQREAVTRDARREHAGRELSANDLRDAHDHVVADVHAEVLVEHVQAVDVDVDHALVALQCLRRQQRLGTLLERRARQQTGRRVVRIHEYVGDAACEQLDDADLPQVEILLVRRLEQHEHAEHLLRPVHDRAPTAPCTESRRAVRRQRTGSRSSSAGAAGSTRAAAGAYA